MGTLNLDIETYSSVDLKKSGVYRYVQAPDFEILMLAYRYGKASVDIIDLAAGEKIPDELMQHLFHPFIVKTAYNAAFERICLSQYLKKQMDPAQWSCTMVLGTMAGFPAGLDFIAGALGLENKKDAAGKALIKYFSIPCKPTAKNGERTRNLPHHDPEKWQQFKDYCKQDVVVEQDVRAAIEYYKPTETEKKLYILDQQINDRGVQLDPILIRNAIRMDHEYKERLTAEALELTGLNNPNSGAQLRNWLSVEFDEEIETLRKDDVPTLLKNAPNETVTRVLELRQEMNKTSVKKFIAMANTICTDKRFRGMAQYYGASRTGRWAGRFVQPQNLPQNHLKDLDLARRLVAENKLDALEICFGSVPQVLSELIRTAFVAPAGSRLGISDLSAIEARVIAWLAGEKWRQQVFATHGKIYEASAAQMFKVPIESITKGSDLRQKGKVSELALGYGGGPNALISMGALKMGLKEDELPKLVKMWRNANPAIVALWETAEDAACTAVETGERIGLQHNIWFFVKHNTLFVELPSGRLLSYVQPKLVPGKYGEKLVYMGMDQTTKKWQRQETYGGKLVENLVQAIARDVLADAMLRIDAAGYPIVLHVHDEAVAELNGKGSVEEMNAIMATPVSWAPGLLLGADGFESTYYKKD